MSERVIVDHAGAPVQRSRWRTYLVLLHTLSGSARIVSRSATQIIDDVMAPGDGAKVSVLAPIVRARKGQDQKELKELLQRPLDLEHYEPILAYLRDTGSDSLADGQVQLFYTDVEKTLKRYIF